MTFWTRERVATVRLWMARAIPTAEAARLCECTGNAVIGKAWRLRKADERAVAVARHVQGCQWPIGDVMAGGRFCGVARQQRSPYCLEHAGKAHGTQEPRKLVADRVAS